MNLGAGGKGALRALGAAALVALLAVGVAAEAAPVAAPTRRQEDPKKPPQDPKEAKRLERERQAEKLWESAQQLMAQGKWAEALAALRNIRDNYFGTPIWSERSREIKEKILECGLKVAATGFEKQTLTKKFHLDTILGIKFNPPDGWRGIPNWQEIFNERDTSEHNYKGRSFRCGRYTSRWLETVYFDVYKTYAPANEHEVADGAFKTYVREPEGYQEVASEKFPHPKHQIQKRIYKDEEGNRAAVYGIYDPQTKKGFGIAGYWRVSKDNSWIVVVDGQKGISDEPKTPPVEDKDWERAVKIYDQIVKTFLILDQAALRDARASSRGSALADDGWFTKCADWNVHTTPNYVIEYATRKDFAERLGKELEEILKLYRRLIPSQKTIAKGRVKLFDGEEDFQYYAQAPGAAAYWSPMQREIVAYRWEGEKVKIGESKEEMTVAEDRNPEEVTFSIIYHEAFHQYMSNIMGISRDVYVPSWLNEGMGDYFFGGRWRKDGTFEIGLNDWRLETIVTAVKEKKHVPLKSIFTYTQEQYYSNAGLCYAQGWAICYFFMSDVGKKNKYHLIPQAFYTELAKSGDFKKVNAKVLSQFDLNKMEEQWKEFVLGLEKFIQKKPEAGADEKGAGEEK